MPLLDHFHPPLHGPRRWEGFHHAWATVIAQHLNQELPPDYFAEPEISLGPELEIDVAALELPRVSIEPEGVTTAVWSPPQPEISAKVDFSHLDCYEIRVYQDLGGAELRAAIELISPSNKDRPGSRQTFAAKCAGYLKQGIALVIVDIVTARQANLHAELFDMLEIKTRRGPWSSPSGLYAVAYRPVPVRKSPRIEVWTQALAIGQPLPLLPLWLSLELSLPLRLEESYLATCQSLRISA
jgi:hypothetical protein